MTSFPVPTVPAPPVGVVGLGQLGGSLAAALVEGGRPVSGWDVDPAARNAAAARGVRIGREMAGVVVLAVPLPAMARALDGLTVDTALERRPTVLAALAAGADAVSLAFEGKRLVFPVHAHAEIEFAATASRPFTARELPGALDDESRLVLVRRLVREGFLRLTPAREPGARA